MGRKIIHNPTQCPLTHAVNIIGGKWKIIIVYLLSDGPLRFGKLDQFLPNTSKKVLTEQLKEMESDGIIIRTKYAEVPPRVEYKLSDKGKALLPIMNTLAEWSEEFMQDVEFEGTLNT